MKEGQANQGRRKEQARQNKTAVVAFSAQARKASVLQLAPTHQGMLKTPCVWMLSTPHPPRRTPGLAAAHAALVAQAVRNAWTPVHNNPWCKCTEQQIAATQVSRSGHALPQFASAAAAAPATAVRGTSIAAGTAAAATPSSTAATFSARCSVSCSRLICE